MLNKEKMIELSKFTHKLLVMGVNGLKQDDFIIELNKFKKFYKIRFFGKKKRIARRIVVVEIRNNPYVKRNFRPNDLTTLLNHNKIEYIRFKNLGNPYYKKHLEMQDNDIAKAEYQEFILSNEKAFEEFNQLYELLMEKKIHVLICYCQNAHCHRFWLRELLINKKRLDLGMEPIITINNQKLEMEVKSHV